MENTISTLQTKYSYTAFFDLDRTISGAISGRALAREAARRGLMRLPDILNGLYLGLTYRLGFGDSVEIMGKMTKWVNGVPEGFLDEVCQSVVKKTMIPTIHNEVFAELEMHRKANACTVILSSTLAPVCRAMADHLKMDDIICSELEIRDGHFTGNPVGNLCFGDEKLKRIREYCEKNNTPVSQAWYYADALVDFPALDAIGFPVCINPERALRNKAMDKGWKIYNWK